MLAAIWLLAATASAQVTNIWTNASSGNWADTTNWSPLAPLSAPATILQFNASGTTAYTASNNLANPFQLNRLVLNSSSSGQITLAGSALQFSPDGLANPQLLQNGSGNVLISNALTLDTNMTFAGAGSGTVTVAGAISGANANFTKSGNYTLVLTVANTFGSPGHIITINGGTLSVNANNRLGNTTNGINLSSNATLQFTGTLTQQRGLTNGAGGGRVEVTGTNIVTFNATAILGGNNPFTKNGTGTLILQAVATRTGTTTNNAGILQLDSATALGANNTNQIVQLNGGTLAHNNATALAATINLNGGTLGATLGAVGGLRVFSGAVSVLNNSAISLADARNPATNVNLSITGRLTGASNLTITAGAVPGVLTLSNNQNTFSGTFIVGSNATLLATHSNGMPLASAAVVLGDGSTLGLRYGSTNRGNSNLTFLASNNVVVTGNTTIDVRRPRFSVNNTGATNITVLGSLNLSSNRLSVTGSNAYSVKFGGMTTIDAGATFNPTTANISLDGLIANGATTASLTKMGNGTLFITNFNNNPYSGGTIVSAGNLQVAGSPSVTTPLGTGDITLNGGVLQLRSDTNQTFGPGAGYAVTVNNTATINVDRFSTNGGTRLMTLGSLNLLATSPARLAVSGANGNTLRIAGLTTFGGNATISNAVALTLDGGISGSTFALTKLGNSRLFLTNLGASFSYGGGTLINAGQVQVYAINGLAGNTPAGSGNITMTGGALELRGAGGVQSFGPGAGYSVTLNGNAIIDVRRFSGNSANGTLILAGLTNNGAQLTVTNANSYTLTFNGPVVINGVATFKIDNGRAANPFSLLLAGPPLTEATPGAIFRKLGAQNLGYTNRANPLHTGGTIIENGTLAWRPNSNLGGFYQFGSGAITLDGGGVFAFQNNVSSNYTLLNNYIVNNTVANGGRTGLGGGLDFSRQTANNPQVTNAGTVTLGGPLVVDGGTAGSGTPARFVNTITVDAPSGSIYVNNSGGGANNRIIVSGNIVSDGTPRQLVVGANNAAGLELSGNNSGLAGILIKPAYVGDTGRIRIMNTNALPGGLVMVESGAYVGLGFSPASLGASLSGLLTRFNFQPGSVLGLDSVTNNYPLDLSATGLNRDIRIGVSEGFSTTNLKPVTPFAAEYKLGGGGGNLLLNGANQLTGAHSLSVNPNPYAGAIGSVQPGTLTLGGSNSFSGGTVVNAGNLAITAGGADTPLGSGLVRVYDTLSVTNVAGSLADATGLANANALLLHPDSTLQLDNSSAFNANRFGDAAALTLNGSRLILNGRNAASTAVTETIGDVTFGWGSQLNLTGSISNNATATLTVNSLNRSGPGTLQLNHATNAAGPGFGDFGILNRLMVATPPTLSNQMMAPYIVNATDHHFVTYDGTLGVVNASYTSADLNGALDTDIVDAGPTMLLGSPTVYALRTTGTITNTSSTDTITLQSGGLLSVNNHGNFANLVFDNGSGPIEGLLYVINTLTNYGSLTASGLTKFGEGTLNLASNQTTYANGWNINRGVVTVSGPNPGLNGVNTALGLTDPANVVNLNGGVSLNFTSVGTNITYASGKIVSLDANVITANLGNQAGNTQTIAPLGLDMNSFSSGPLGSALRFDVDQSRSLLRVGGPVTLNADASFNVRNTGGADNNTGGSNRLDFAGGLVGGSRTLTKFGNGILGLRTDNSATFTGGVINVNGGTLALSHNGAVGDAASTVNIASNAVLEILAGTIQFLPTATVNQKAGSAERWQGALSRFVNANFPETYILPPNVNLQVAVSLTNLTSKNIRLNGGSIEAYNYVDDARTINNILITSGVTIQLGADSKIGQSGVDVGKSGTIFSNNASIVDFGGSRSLSKIGPDTVVLGGLNSWSGQTFVNEGTLRLGVTDGLPTTTILNVNDAAIFDLNNFDQTVSGLNGNGRITNSVNTNRTLVVYSPDPSVFSGTIRGNLNLNKSGSGSLTLSGANTYNGSTQIADGSVRVGADAVNGTSPLGIFTAQVLLTGDSGVYTAGPYTVPQGVLVDPSVPGTKTIGGDSAHVSTFNGPITLLDPVNLTAAAGGRVSFNGVISETTGGGLSVTKSGEGIVNLTADNIYTGPTAVNAGTLLVNNSTGSGTGAGDVTVNAGATLGGSGHIAGSVTIFEGALKPGNSAGALRIDNNLSLQSLASMSFEIGGLLQTNEYDFVSVGGNVDFFGALQLSLLNSFLPPTNLTWTLIEFASRTGTFENASNGSRLTTTDNLGSFKVNYSANNLVASEFLYKDNDADGIADAWALKYFGQTPLPNGTGPNDRFGDKDGDGLSNYGEYVAGTDPLDEHSVFRVMSAGVMGSNSFAVQFTYLAGKTYRIQFTSDMASWMQVNSPLLTFPQADLAQWIDDGTQTGGTAPLNLGTPRFYRVLVQ